MDVLVVRKKVRKKDEDHSSIPAASDSRLISNQKKSDKEIVKEFVDKFDTSLKEKSFKELKALLCKVCIAYKRIQDSSLIANQDIGKLRCTESMFRQIRDKIESEKIECINRVMNSLFHGLTYAPGCPAGFDMLEESQRRSIALDVITTNIKTFDKFPPEVVEKIRDIVLKIPSCGADVLRGLEGPIGITNPIVLRNNLLNSGGSHHTSNNNHYTNENSGNRYEKGNRNSSNHFNANNKQVYNSSGSTFPDSNNSKSNFEDNLNAATYGSRSRMDYSQTTNTVFEGNNYNDRNNITNNNNAVVNHFSVPFAEPHNPPYRHSNSTQNPHRSSRNDKPPPLPHFQASPDSYPPGFQGPNRRNSFSYHESPPSHFRGRGGDSFDSFPRPPNSFHHASPSHPPNHMDHRERSRDRSPGRSEVPPGFTDRPLRLPSSSSAENISNKNFSSSQTYHQHDSHHRNHAPSSFNSNNNGKSSIQPHRRYKDDDDSHLLPGTSETSRFVQKHDPHSHHEFPFHQDGSNNHYDNRNNQFNENYQQNYNNHQFNRPPIDSIESSNRNNKDHHLQYYTEKSVVPDSSSNNERRHEVNTYNSHENLSNMNYPPNGNQHFKPNTNTALSNDNNHGNVNDRNPQQQHQSIQAQHSAPITTNIANFNDFDDYDYYS